MLSKEVIKQYNKVRDHTDKSLLCHAPFANLNFEQNGNMRACCYNIDHILGTYPATSVAEAWTGAKADELRGYIRSNDLGGGCKSCEELIESKNYEGSKSLHYDLYAWRSENPIKKLLDGLTGTNTGRTISPPKVFEFELSNTCNLECEMCTGYFSSTIRKNREKLPPMHNPYDDAFVEQVAQFIPGLTEMKFLGGEPFLIDVYHKIWDKAIELNPNVRIHITTNGTVMNQRVRDLVQKMNCAITVSIDALEPANYERIRAGAKYERVMANIMEFMTMLKAKGKLFSIAICPMTVNWHELPDFVTFANEHDIDTHYNTLWRPEHLSLRYMKPAELRKAIAVLDSKTFTVTSARQKMNVKRYNEVVNTLKYWLNETVEKSLQSIYLHSDEGKLMASLPTDNLAQSIVLLTLKEQMDILGYEKYPNIEKLLLKQDVSETEQTLESFLQKIADTHTGNQFMIAYLSAMASLQKIYYAQAINTTEFQNRIALLKENINQLETVHPSIIEGAVKANLLKATMQISNRPMDIILFSFQNGVPRVKQMYTGNTF